MKMGDGADPLQAYDANGNIKRMQQWGLKITGSIQIDELAYIYQTNSNKLAKVTDTYTDPTTRLGDFKDGTNVGVDDYSYDENGNMKKDRNKDIGDGSNDGIEYNHLNLPQTITVRTATGAVKGTISYTYDAGGNKLKKTVTEIGASVTYQSQSYTTDIISTTNYTGACILSRRIM